MCKTYFSLEKNHKLALKLEKFENFDFFEKKSPQLKNFKKSPRVVEISADLKNKKNSKNKCKRCFWDPGAFFLDPFWPLGDSEISDTFFESPTLGPYRPQISFGTLQ